MSYIKYGLIQCDQCKDSFVTLIPGMLMLMEVPGKPKIIPIASWPTYHFCNLEELREWVEDREQIIG